MIVKSPKSTTEWRELVHNTPRPGNYRYPQINDAARPILHNNDRNRMRRPRPSALTSNTHLHFQESLSPTHVNIVPKIV